MKKKFQDMPETAINIWKPICREIHRLMIFNNLTSEQTIIEVANYMHPINEYGGKTHLKDVKSHWNLYKSSMYFYNPPTEPNPDWRNTMDAIKKYVCNLVDLVMEGRESEMVPFSM